MHISSRFWELGRENPFSKGFYPASQFICFFFVSIAMISNAGPFISSREVVSVLYVQVSSFDFDFVHFYILGMKVDSGNVCTFDPNYLNKHNHSYSQHLLAC